MHNPPANGKQGRYTSKNVTNHALERLQNLKTGREPLGLRPRTDDARHQKPTPSRETAPLNVLVILSNSSTSDPNTASHLELLCELA